MVLQKPIIKLDWLTPPHFVAAPQRITVWELNAGGNTLVTSLLSVKETPWHIELDLRNIKTTLGMDTLNCKTPTTNEKEMWVYFLSYYLIRLRMASAALFSHLLPRQFSIKHTLQLWSA